MSRYPEKSDTLEDIEFLRELGVTKRNEKEPGRWDYALKKIQEKGYQTEEDFNEKCIKFNLRGNIIKFYPYKGWFTGKGVKDGRGINKLLKQI